jgi:hypothetical protein
MPVRNETASVIKKDSITPTRKSLPDGVRPVLFITQALCQIAQIFALWKPD